MITKLLPSVKLPYEISRGSMAQKSAKAEDFINKLSDETVNIIENKTINKQKLQEVIDNLLPEQIRIQVLKNQDQNVSGTNDIRLNNKWEITDLTMELDFLQNELPQEQIVDIVHEGRHIADSLFNPKYLVRQQTLEQKGLYTKKFLDFYDNQLYIREFSESKRDIKDTIKIIKRKLHEVLRGHSTEDKINIIQDMRYGLETEKNAYNTQFIYGEKYNKSGMNIDEDYYSGYDEYLFDEKLKMLKQTAFEIIQKARTNFSCKLKKKNSRSAKPLS